MLTFTLDFQSSNDLGRRVAFEYEAAAREAARPFVPVYLVCSVDENLKRATSLDRANGGTTKLTDMEVLSDLRSRCELFRFENYPSLTIDVTTMSPVEAATKIFTHIKSVWTR